MEDALFKKEGMFCIYLLVWLEDIFPNKLIENVNPIWQGHLSVIRLDVDLHFTFSLSSFQYNIILFSSLMEVCYFRKISINAKA